MLGTRRGNALIHPDCATAGALAGAASRTVVSPLERLKIILQVQGPSPQYKGVLPSLVKMWKEEGFRGECGLELSRQTEADELGLGQGYMRGNGVNVLRILP